MALVRPSPLVGVVVATVVVVPEELGNRHLFVKSLSLGDCGDLKHAKSKKNNIVSKLRSS